MRSLRSPDGDTWNALVKLPSHSSAMIVFQHAGGQSAAGDRYAWINASPESVIDPRERLSATALLEKMSEEELLRLFQRSMAVRTPLSVPRPSVRRRASGLG